jgi:methylmalonyl-CoA mutase
MTVIPKEVIRATEAEKQLQLSTLSTLHKTYAKEAEKALVEVKQAAIENNNIFEALMEATKYCSLGQITTALFEVGGQYRRNM